MLLTPILKINYFIPSQSMNFFSMDHHLIKNHIDYHKDYSLIAKLISIN